MAGTFEIYKDRKGKFRDRLKSSNGQIVASGEGYPTKSHVKRGPLRCSAPPRAPRSRTSATDD